MTSQPMDFRDYLIRQQQQERMAQRFDGAVFEVDEDHAADQAELVSRTRRTTQPRSALSAPSRSRRR